jgi:hypothetical protein
MAYYLPVFRFFWIALYNTTGFDKRSISSLESCLFLLGPCIVQQPLGDVLSVLDIGDVAKKGRVEFQMHWHSLSINYISCLFIVNNVRPGVLSQWKSCLIVSLW